MLSTPACKMQGKAKTTETLVEGTSELSPCGERELCQVQGSCNLLFPQLTVGESPSFPGSGFYLQNPTLSNSAQPAGMAQITPYPSMCPELFKLIILAL